MPYEPNARRTKHLRRASLDRARHIKRKYGLTVAEYAEWFHKAGHRCEACARKPEKLKDLHLDHCHASGKIRGVLCRDCNHALGNARDREDVLLNLAAYLKKQSA